jgi:hypothetical protein
MPQPLKTLHRTPGFCAPYVPGTVVAPLAEDVHFVVRVEANSPGAALLRPAAASRRAPPLTAGARHALPRCDAGAQLHLRGRPVWHARRAGAVHEHSHSRGA